MTLIMVRCTSCGVKMPIREAATTAQIVEAVEASPNWPAELFTLRHGCLCGGDLVEDVRSTNRTIKEHVEQAMRGEFDAD